MIGQVRQVYYGSNGEATAALYARLEKLGPVGIVALNLMRACKASERAKKYRGGNGRSSYRAMAYDKKQWSMDNLCRELVIHGDTLGLDWGWGIEPGAGARRRSACPRPLCRASDRASEFSYRPPRRRAGLRQAMGRRARGIAPPHHRLGGGLADIDGGGMSKPIRVQRKRTKGWKMPPNTVSVARPGPLDQPCHADVLLELANSQSEGERA